MMSLRLRLITCIFNVFLALPYVQTVTFPYGPAAGDSTVIANDDQPYSLYVDNGVISFNETYTLWSTQGPLPGIYPPLVAVFHGDYIGYGPTYTRGLGPIYTRESTAASDLSLAASYVTELFPQLSPFNPTSVAVVTWDGFDLYLNPSSTNTFQAALVSSPTASVVLLLYERILVFSSNTVVGVTAGDGVQFENHPLSRTSSVVDLDTIAQAVTPGLHGFIVYQAPVPTTAPTPPQELATLYCVRNSSDDNLVDVTVSVFSNLFYYLLALNTTAFQNGIRQEVTRNDCRTASAVTQANISFTVNISNTADPGCGVTHTNGILNVTIDAIQQLEIYQANDTVFSLSCNVLDYKDSVLMTVGDILTSTVPAVTGRSVSLRFQDRLDYAGSQAFRATDEVQIGRFIFPTICFFRGSPYTPDVDPYGVYAYSCQLANNPLFRNGGDFVTLDLTDSNGCLVQSPVQAIVQRHNFKDLSDTGSPSSPFCISTGGFPAFNWRTGESKIYMRCFVGFCRNTQLYQQSRCKDSCRYTLIDVNATDPDDKRRRRRDNTEDEPIEVLASITVKNLETDNETNAGDTETPLTVSSRCIDRTFAEGVILSLVAALVLATALVLVLFYTVEVRMRPGIESTKRNQVPLQSNKP